MMLRFICFTLLFMLAIGLELQAKLNGHWQKFKSAHGKQYSGAEEEKRKGIFKKNVDAILQHNLKSDLGESSFTLGINEFSDMDHDEFVKTMCGTVVPTNYTKDNEVMIPSVRVAAPPSIDWRSLGAVTPVKNQGNCGSCWTFGAVGTVEGAWFKNHKELVPLSEQNLLDCSSNSKYGNQGCNGGWPHTAMQYIMDNRGINAQSCYAYKGRVGSCAFNRNCKNVQISKFVNVPSGNDNALLEAVANGPVSVAINAGNSDFRNYKKGVYSPRSCSQQVNHAVTLVGYGEENKQPFWLIKNSWGTSWGDGGYMKMARNINNICGISSYASYAVAA